MKSIEGPMTTEMQNGESVRLPVAGRELNRLGIGWGSVLLDDDMAVVYTLPHPQTGKRPDMPAAAVRAVSDAAVVAAEGATSG